MNKIFLFLTIFACALVITGTFIYSPNKEMPHDNVYQGPVRPTDDLDYFRKTGITKPLEVKE